MNKELKLALIAAFNKENTSNFSAEQVNEGAIRAIMEAVGLTENSSARDIREATSSAFALIEEAIDEVLPKRLDNILGQFAEVKTFDRNQEVIFNIEKIGRNRAKLTISKGARGGIYRAARLDSKSFSVPTNVETVAMYVTLEELISGSVSLAELYTNIVEGFEQVVYQEVFNALATGTPVAGYNRIDGGNADNVSTTKAALTTALDKVLPYVKQYGLPTIFGSYMALSEIANPTATNHPELEDSADRRNYGFVQVYKGHRVVELPNYLIDSANAAWAYDPSYVFVVPSGVKPVKVALKGDLYIQKNTQAVGSEKWEAHKLIGVGVAMANNFAVIKVTDVQ